MAHMDLTNKNFDSIIGNGVTLVDFWADWCGPCKMQAPVIDELGEKYEGKVTVAKLNVDDEPSIAARFGVMSIPTLIVWAGGGSRSRAVPVNPSNRNRVLPLQRERVPHFHAEFRWYHVIITP